MAPTLLIKQIIAVALDPANSIVFTFLCVTVNCAHNVVKPQDTKS